MGWIKDAFNPNRMIDDQSDFTGKPRLAPALACGIVSNEDKSEACVAFTLDDLHGTVLYGLITSEAALNALIAQLQQIRGEINKDPASLTEYLESGEVAVYDGSGAKLTPEQERLARAMAAGVPVEIPRGFKLSDGGGGKVN